MSRWSFIRVPNGVAGPALRSILWLPALVPALMAPQAQGATDNLSDCRKQSIEAVRERVVDPSGLKPTILSSDLLRMSICNPTGQALDAGAQARLEDSYDLQEVPLASLPTQLKSGAVCPNSGECRVEIFRSRELGPLGDPTKFGLSGGLPFAAFLGHLGTKGHYEITTKALLLIGASKSAIAIMAAASRDPDLYEWNEPAAHAQTPNLDDGQIDSLAAGNSQDAFLNWVQRGLRRTSSLCQKGQPRNAAYALGYAMHAVQDLSFHEGITNAEHSFRDYGEGQDVGVDFKERFDEKFDLGIAASTQFVERARSVLPASCWASMMDLSGHVPLTSEEKQLVIGKSSTDFGPIAFLKYRKLAGLVYLLTIDPTVKLFVTPRWVVEPRKESITRILDKIDYSSMRFSAE